MRPLDPLESAVTPPAPAPPAVAKAPGAYAAGSSKVFHQTTAEPSARSQFQTQVQAQGQAQAQARDAGRVVVLVLSEVAAAHRLWGWSRLVLQRWPLRAVPGLVFSKVLGSGYEGGFGLRPSGSRQGLFLGFGSVQAAQAFVQTSPVMQAYRRRSRECCVAVLQATSSKGCWSGAALSVEAEAQVDAHAAGPVASLTRASIKPGRLSAFWRMQPAAERSLQQAAGCELAVGLGEAPLLRQCTFSLWRDHAALDAYARSGAHLQAIKAAYAGQHFSESMFVRFAPLSVQGLWKGQRFDYAV